MHDDMPGHEAADVLKAGLGRRDFLRAVAASAATGAVVAGGAREAQAAAEPAKVWGPAPSTGPILQTGRGPIAGDLYLPSRVEQVRWGYVPSVTSEPVMRMASGRTVTIDAVSHEGILEDQGRNPIDFFAQFDVRRRQVLDDAAEIAREYDRHPRNFDVDGPHVVTGPIYVDGAEPGDVLKIEPLSLLPRVPYGVVSSRHGKGALPRLAGGAVPAGMLESELMPSPGTDHRASGVPARYGNVSVFTPVKNVKGTAYGEMPAGRGHARFPLNPFMGMMGVAFAPAETIPDQKLNSIPPTLGGGNIDIKHLGLGSTFYLPVFAPGALFYVGDPHHAMGNGEVALTAMEGSLRGTFRLTVCKKGSGDAPAIAHRYPFAETKDAWIPIGLSDPDGIQNGQVNDLNIAMRRAVVNALDFLQEEKGMDRQVAYAYLSAAADFEVSQVVDRTVGIHGLIRKAHFVS